MKKYLRNNMNMFDKIDWIKQLASDAIGVSDEVVLRRMLSRLCRKGRGLVRKYGVLHFSQQELILEQLLKSNEVSPLSAYRWFLLIRAPEEISELGQKSKISQNEIERRMQGVRQKSDPEREKLGREILLDIVRIVEAM